MVRKYLPSPCSSSFVLIISLILRETSSVGDAKMRTDVMLGRSLFFRGWNGLVIAVQWKVCHNGVGHSAGDTGMRILGVAVFTQHAQKSGWINNRRRGWTAWTRLDDWLRLSSLVYLFIWYRLSSRPLSPCERSEGCLSVPSPSLQCASPLHARHRHSGNQRTWWVCARPLQVDRRGGLCLRGPQFLWEYHDHAAWATACCTLS